MQSLSRYRRYISLVGCQSYLIQYCHNLKSSIFFPVLPGSLKGGICFNFKNAGVGQITSLELPVAVGQTLITDFLTSPPQDLLHPDLSPPEMFLFSPPDLEDDEED